MCSNHAQIIGVCSDLSATEDDRRTNAEKLRAQETPVICKGVTAVGEPARCADANGHPKSIRLRRRVSCERKEQLFRHAPAAFNVQLDTTDAPQWHSVKGATK
eukprot:SAG11_NODE_1055_length_6017_cov_1.548496_10_plen_103_part_00